MWSDYPEVFPILTTSRGCPFDCWYCAQKASERKSTLKVQFDLPRTRWRSGTIHTYGIHEIAFYEDNFLLEKPNIERLLKLLVEHKHEMPHLKLYAPEGVEVRLFCTKI